MIKFSIKIAGLKIGIYAIYDRVKDMCSDYIDHSDEPDFTVTITDSDIAKEAVKNDFSQEAMTPQIAAYLETLAVYRKIAENVLSFDTFLMHGSVVAVGDDAFMITAKSGIGKTTRTGFWLEQIQNSYVVNGDKPLIRIKDGQVYACGTPWRGKENLGSNRMVPLKGIYFLERAEENSIEEISFSDAFSKLMKQTYQPESSLNLIKTLNLLKQLDGKVRFFVYRSNLDRASVKLAYEAAIESVYGSKD